MAATKYGFTKVRFAVGASLGGYGKFADKQARAAAEAGASLEGFETDSLGARQFGYTTKASKDVRETTVFALAQVKVADLAVAA